MRFTFALGDAPLQGYTIKRGIGLGGFGEVYYAVSDAGKEVAIKRIQRNVDIEVRGVQQCINLKSPNLVAIYDIRKDDHGDVWVVMEYVQGENLKDVIDQHPGGLPVEAVIHWFRGILSGVSHLHDHGIVHRDLKPGNIFEEQGVVKVGDYGLCKIISCSRRDGHTESVGTVHYMAPEIGKGQYGKEIDVYALGIILFELITGTVPFEGETTQEILFKHLTAEPDLRQLDPRIRALVARALHKDPQRRFRDAAEMLAAFDRAVGAEPSAQPVLKAAVPAGAVAGAATPEPSHAAPNAAGGTIPPRFAAAPERPPVIPPVWSSSPTDEPIANALANGYTRFMRWWHGSSMGMAARGAIIAGVIAVVILTAGVSLPVVLVLSTMYVTYLVARALIRPPTGMTAAAEAHVAPGRASHGGPRRTRSARSEPVASRFRRARPWQQMLRDRKLVDAATRRHIARRGLRHELRDLVASALLATAIVTLLTIAMMALAGQLGDVSASQITFTSWWLPFLWISATSAIATWSLLILGAVWRRQEEVTFHRFPQFFFGLLVGLGAYLMAQYLMLTFKPGVVWEPDTIPTLNLPDNMYGVDGQPTLLAFLIYFGTLWALVSWWKTFDPCRSRPWRLGRVIVAGVAAWILAALWEFPQPWGIFVAVNTAVATQLVSPWIAPKKRRKILEDELRNAPAEV